jgi:hypothetical protein
VPRHLIMASPAGASDLDSDTGPQLRPSPGIAGRRFEPSSAVKAPCIPAGRCQKDGATAALLLSPASATQSSRRTGAASRDEQRPSVSVSAAHAGYQRAAMRATRRSWRRRPRVGVVAMSTANATVCRERVLQ